MVKSLIRPAMADDAEAISHVVVRTLRETNARDYPPEVIASVVPNFAPERIVRLLAEREVLVAVVSDEVIGTASLERSAIRTVFIAPEYQGCGVGTALVRELEEAARRPSITQLVVPSSVTAKGFYARLGFIAMRDEYHGTERTIIMERALA